MFESSPAEPTATTSWGFETTIVVSVRDNERDKRGRTGRVEAALDRLKPDREAEGEEEDAVDEGTENFGTLPAVRVARRGGRGFSELDRLERDDETAHVVKHVERVGHERERSNRVAADEFHEEEDRVLGKG